MQKLDGGLHTCLPASSSACSRVQSRPHGHRLTYSLARRRRSRSAATSRRAVARFSAAALAASSSVSSSCQSRMRLTACTPAAPRRSRRSGSAPRYSRTRRRSSGRPRRGSTRPPSSTGPPQRRGWGRLPRTVRRHQGTRPSRGGSSPLNVRRKGQAGSLTKSRPSSRRMMLPLQSLPKTSLHPSLKMLGMAHKSLRRSRGRLPRQSSVLPLGTERSRRAGLKTRTVNMSLPPEG